jgi:lysophospholipase L1-like esterase
MPRRSFGISRPRSVRSAACAVLAGILASTLAAVTAPAAAGADPNEPTPGTRPAEASARAAAVAEPGGLGLAASHFGHVSRSVAAVASDDTSGADATVTKPAGATVLAAYLAYATTGFTNQQLSSPLTLDGQPVPLDRVTANGISGYNYFADVTALVKAKLDAAAAGPVALRVAEPQPELTEGSILTIVYDDPAVTVKQTVSILYGALSPTGDSYQVQLSSPIKLSDSNTRLEMSLGISYSYQESGAQQYSTVMVNGRQVTGAAGGSDDGLPHNGALITVGGEGDVAGNPDNPTAGPTGARSDDELYDLRPLVKDGDTSIRVETSNPSLDDNVFFALFAMNPPATTIATGGSGFVAMGDSFQSGEGAHHYEPDTDVEGNRCHRSTVSYPYLIKGKTGIPINLTAVACSGARIHNLADGQNGEPPQYDALNERTALVTIGIGGNDLEFAEIIKACVLGPQLSGDFFSAQQTCHQRFDAQVNRDLLALDTRDEDGLSPLERVYHTVRERAPHARILVLGYPRFFKSSGNFFGCQLVYRSDQKWIAVKIDEADTVIRRNAEGMGAEYVAGADLFDGHELCGDGEEYMNGIVGLGDSESFHPNAAGHEHIAEVIVDYVRTHQPTSTFTVQQDQTITFDVIVDQLRALVSFFTSWPGSQVTMTITDPNGRVISANALDQSVLHRAGPTSELFRIANPAPGTWRVALFGKDVRAGGEPVSLSVAQPPRPNRIPVAVSKQHADRAGTTVTYTAHASYDPDGTITSYEWDFGDGTTATGKKVTHTYTNIGHLDQPTLIVTDNQGALGFKSLPAVKVHYGFVGLQSMAPCVGDRRARAGDELRFAWRLTDPTGKAVTDPKVVASYSFGTAGAQYKLTVDRRTGIYVATIRTPKSWRHTTQVFTLKLNDNSVHTARVRFS